jgi:hypothetical protein
MFHKRSEDGSAKCDAYNTGNENDFVLGVLLGINQSEMGNLDRAEGCGYGYKRKDDAIVLTDCGKRKSVTYYYATDTDIDSNLKPYSWYKHHVLVGAKENSLPAEYVARIEEIDSIPDQDKARESKELSIYE